MTDLSTPLLIQHLRRLAACARDQGKLSIANVATLAAIRLESYVVGGRKGGLQRAKNLSPARRHEIAVHAGQQSAERRRTYPPS